ncbi:hypothetical protein [Thioclava atlantica]|uniref:Uncharacterized protein n=1 Tax=Thioclava atlantica TaxID=1317124 RepID=A0A085TZR2_9RHOB|nr:hypothetical protein [Thioclava atlantica]KFE36209.1 hypothetical protein DW2_02824 [Thioclava atlantica]
MAKISRWWICVQIYQKMAQIKERDTVSGPGSENNILPCVAAWISVAPRSAVAEAVSTRAPGEERAFLFCAMGLGRGL